MLDQLENLQLDLVRYREAVDQIFSSTLTTPRNWQQQLLEILVCASQLYLDYLLVLRNLPALEAFSSEGNGSTYRVREDTLRERNLREKLKHELESSPSWNHFRPENPFSGLTGLRTLQDYTDRFTLHLPEIYGETFRAEACTKDFLANRNASALAQLVVALQHLGQNHIAFVLQALEWASDENSWEESLVSPKEQRRKQELVEDTDHMLMERSSSNSATTARWYVAELILKITVEGDRRNVVHRDLVLIQAESAEGAYQKGLHLGHENQLSYENPSGKKVEISFQGLGKLVGVNDRLEDGAELSYEEYVDVPDEKIREWALPKNQLTVFRQIEPSSEPDYSSREILEEASRMTHKNH